MKYGCAIDCNLLCLNGNNTFTTDENASRCTNQDYSMTSSFMSDELSGLSSMAYVDRAVHDIMSNNSPNKFESNKNNIMKFLINCLHGQIETMKQEIAFLRTDSKCKNSTIDQLFNFCGKTIVIVVHPQYRIQVLICPN